jgi:hypothetical protein
MGFPARNNAGNTMHETVKLCKNPVEFFLQSNDIQELFYVVGRCFSAGRPRRRAVEDPPEGGFADHLRSRRSIRSTVERLAFASFACVSTGMMNRAARALRFARIMGTSRVPQTRWKNSQISRIARSTAAS